MQAQSDLNAMIAQMASVALSGHRFARVICEPDVDLDGADALQVTVVLADDDTDLSGDDAANIIVDLRQALQSAGDTGSPSSTLQTRVNWPRMSILNPNHLREQADGLIAAPPAGPPRQVDLRRAISSAYCALFHLTLTALADELVGALHRNTLRDALIHRSVSHSGIKDLCLNLSKSPPSSKYATHVPASFLARNFRIFAGPFLALQNQRHLADDDVHARNWTLNTKLALARSRTGIAAFRNSIVSQKKMSRTLLLCPPR